MEVIQKLTKGIGADRASDAVGLDAVHAKRGPALKTSEVKQFEEEMAQVAKALQAFPLEPIQ